MDPISNHCHCVIYRRNSEGNDVTFGNLIFGYNDDRKPSVAFLAWTVIAPHKEAPTSTHYPGTTAVNQLHIFLRKNALRCFKRLLCSRILKFLTRIPFIPTTVSLRTSLVYFFHQSQSQLPELRISSSLQSCSICLRCKAKLIEQPRFVLPGDLLASEKWSLED